MAKEFTLNDVMDFLRKNMVTKEDLRNYFNDSKIKYRPQVNEEKNTGTENDNN